MSTVCKLILGILTAYWLIPTCALAQDREPGFAEWLEGLREEALAEGISQKTLDDALTGLDGPLPRVLELDRKQPETTQSLGDYVAVRVSRKRIADGRWMMTRYRTWLGRIEQKYGVQRRIIVALWGIESNYGEHSGNFPVIPALATLARDERRGAYFRRELLDALKILDAGHIPLQQMRGSWAGAMGQCQFMPSSFRRYAVDADGDGRIDLWNSTPDVLASTANYLAKAGWNGRRTWGRPVRVPKEFDGSQVGLEFRRPLADWAALGVRRNDASPLPRGKLGAALLQPDGPGGPAFLVYDNFRVLRAWNRSNSFAVAVGTLSDRISQKD
jgi:membrane-bound lytic murein transglycosylase B